MTMRRTHLPLFVFGAAFLGACSAATALDAVTGRRTASGRISLSVNMDGSRAQHGSSTMAIELAQADLAFNLGDMLEDRTPDGTVGVGWNPAQYGGTVNWYEIYVSPTPTNGCMSRDSIVRVFSSAAAGGQPGDVSLTIAPNGHYEIAIDAGNTGKAATTSTETQYSVGSCPGASPPFTFTSSLTGVPFSDYFRPHFGGATGVLTGTITPGANRVNGSWQGIDTLSVDVPVPVTVRVTWDITFK
jgi:hypothetical protein